MRFFIILVMLTALPVQAEIYKWVDEKGKTHFGDRVPQQYQKNAGNVDVNIRQPSADDIAAAQQRNEDLANSAKMMESSQSARRKSGSSARNKTGKSGSGYDKQMSEYRLAKSCYAACQVRRPVMPGQGRTGFYLDNSACGHCTDATKPQR
jgi:hypothetical protein